MMNESRIDFEEQLILLLFFSKNYSSIKTRLMKLLFLFNQIFRLSTTKDLGFKPYNYGPWASNFESHITPLKIQGLIDSDYDRAMHRYFLVDTIIEKIEELIKEKYLSNDNISDDISLVRFFGEKYTDFHVNDLIQLIYVLEPDFTDKSTIKDEIMSLSKDYNQQIIIELIKEIPTQYIYALFNNDSRISRILLLSNLADPDDVDQKFVHNLVVHFNTIYQNPDFQVRHLLEALYNYPKNGKYESLKLALISIFTMIEPSHNHLIYRNLLLFMFRVIHLTYPLLGQEYERFNQYLVELKQSFDDVSFFDDIDDFTNEELVQTKYLHKKAFEEIGSSVQLRTTKQDVPPAKSSLVQDITSSGSSTESPNSFLFVDESDEEEDKEANKEYEEHYPIS